MRRALRWTVRITVGLAGLVVLLFLVVLVLANSRFGQERVRRYAERWLADSPRISGTVTMGRIAGASLLRGVSVHDVSIVGPDGRPFVRADSLQAGYDWGDLIRGRISIGRLTVFGVDLQLERLPGDENWNYQRILVPSTEPSSGPARLVTFGDVRLAGGTVVVRLPWDGGSGEEAQRWFIEDLPGGPVRVFTFTLTEAKSARVRLQSPDHDAMLIEIDALAGQANVFRKPITVRDARGSVVVSDSAVNIDLRNFRLPDSEGSATGRVQRGGDGGWDFRIEATRFALADLEWLDPRVPEEGSGRAIVRIRSAAADAIEIDAQDLEVTAMTSRVSGRAGIVMGRQLLLRGVDLRAAPLDVEWLAGVLERDIPLAGQVTGRIQADGPLARLQTRGELRLNERGGQVLARWNGGVSMNGAFAARGLNVDIENLDLALLDALRPGIPITGKLSGSLGLDGQLATGLALRGRLDHTGAAGARSQLDGGGTLTTSELGTRFDLEFESTPLALETLASLSPALDSLRGTATGTIAARGHAMDFEVRANVRTDAGPLRLTARVDRTGATPHIVVDGRMVSFEPFRLGLVTQEARLSGTVHADVRGSALAELEGPVRIALDSARVRNFPIETSRFDLVLGSGMARIDTAVVRAPGFDVAGRGEIGLDEGHPGRLALQVGSGSLAPLEVWAFGRVADPTQPRVRGTVDGHAVVTGSIESFDVEADAALDRFGWDAHEAARIGLVLRATGLGSSAPDWHLDARLDSLRVGGRQADSARVALASDGELTTLHAELWNDTTRMLRGRASWMPESGGGLLRVSELAFRSQDRDWTLADSMIVHIAEGVARVEPTRILPSSGAGLLGVRGTIALFGVDSAGVADALNFDVDLARVPFGDFISIVRAPVRAQGTLDATLRVTGTTARPLIDGEVVIRDLEFEGASLDRITLSIDYADRNLVASASALQAGREVMVGSGSIPLDLTGAGERRPDLPLSFNMRLDSFPAAFGVGPLPGFSELEGVIDGTIGAGGTTRSPALNGTLLLRRGAATWNVTGVRYIDVEGTLRSNQDLVVAVDVSARTVDARGRTPGGARGGGVRVTGHVDLAQPSNPGLALQLSADRILAARRRDADLITSGRIEVTGQYRRPIISGSATVDGGNLYLDELYRRYLIVQLEDPLLFNLVDTSLVAVRRVLPPSQSPFVRNMRIDNVSVTVSAGSWLRSREMDVEVTGDLIIFFDRQEEDLRMSGTLNAVRGTYRLEYPPFARVFEVEGGTVEFPGTPGIDPILDIVASHTARTRDEPLRIEAVLTGSLQNPRVRLRSDAEPPISESDLASYLFFGAPTYGIAGGPGGGGVFGSLGRQALTATGLGYVASGLQTLAQSFGIVDYVGLTAAEAAGPGQQSTFESLLSSTRIELGRYLSPRVFVAYTQRLGSPANDAGVRLEWRYHPTYTLELFAEDRFARTPSISLSQAIAARKVYGFFIFREWSY